jgi:glycosyltransferase involved in cell wall biosynthesis
LVQQKKINNKTVNNINPEVFMRVLLLITQLEAGGAQKAAFTLAKGLKENNHYVQVVAIYDKNGSISHFRNKYQVPIIDLGMKDDKAGFRLKSLFIFLRGLVKFFFLITAQKFDILQSFTHYSNFLGPIIGFIGGIPIRISSQRSMLNDSPKWVILVDKIIANSFLVDKMVAVSEETKKFCVLKEKIKSEKIITIYNCIAPEHFSIRNVHKEIQSKLLKTLKADSSTHIIITIARLHPIKGHEYLLSAIPMIVDTHPDCVFLIVGEGELKSELQNQSKDLEISHIVHFLGERHDIKELLAISDIFILPSISEGMPNSVLEAMAMGTPVIATNVGGSCEIIIHGENGFLIPPKNIDEIVSSTRTLLNNPSLRNKFSEKGKTSIKKKFTQEKFISSFLILYEDMLKEKGKAK